MDKQTVLPTLCDMGCEPSQRGVGERDDIDVRSTEQVVEVCGVVCPQPVGQGLRRCLGAAIDLQDVVTRLGKSQ